MSCGVAPRIVAFWRIVFMVPSGRRAYARPHAHPRDPSPRRTRRPQEQRKLALARGPEFGAGDREARRPVQPRSRQPAPALEGASFGYGEGVLITYVKGAPTKIEAMRA